MKKCVDALIYLIQWIVAHFPAFILTLGTAVVHAGYIIL